MGCTHWWIQGAGHTRRIPPKGPNSFLLTYKFFETQPRRESAPPLRGCPPPPMGNPGSATGTLELKLMNQE